VRLRCVIKKYNAKNTLETVASTSPELTEKPPRFPAPKKIKVPASVTANPTQNFPVSLSRHTSQANRATHRGEM